MTTTKFKSKFRKCNKEGQGTACPMINFTQE